MDWMYGKGKKGKSPWDVKAKEKSDEDSPVIEKGFTKKRDWTLTE